MFPYQEIFRLGLSGEDILAFLQPGLIAGEKGHNIWNPGVQYTLSDGRDFPSLKKSVCKEASFGPYSQKGSW